MIQLTTVAEHVTHIIRRAEAAGVVIDDGNVIDLLADNIMLPLETIRQALAVSAVARRFSQATRPRQ